MKRNFFTLSGWLVTSFFVTAQLPAIAQEVTMSAPDMSSNVQSKVPTMGNIPRPAASLIDIQDQAVPDGKLFVKQVDTPNIGWLVVRESIGGQPGAILGYVALHTGGNENVTVPLSALPKSGTAIVSVHAAPRSARTLNSFDLIAYPLAKGGNKSAISTVNILPNNAMQVATPGL